MKKKLKIILKDKWGFWFFKRYSVVVEDEYGSLTELHIKQTEWTKCKEGDYYEIP